MSTRSIFPRLMILLVCIFSVSHASSSENANTAVVKKIALKRQVHVNAVRDENIEEVLQYYADDVRLMPEANPTILGKENARDYFTQLFDRFEMKKYSSKAIETITMQGYAVEIGSFNLEMKNSSGELRALAGKYADLWLLDDKGKLSLIATAWNYDYWPEFKDELQFKSLESVTTAFGQQVPLAGSAAFELEAYSMLNTAAVLQGDARILSGMYSEDGILMPNYHEVVVGKKDIYPYWVKHAAELPMFENLDNSSDKIIDIGEHVIQFASHLAVYRGDSYSGVSTGKHLRIWKRGSDGRLQTKFLISAYDN